MSAIVERENKNKANERITVECPICNQRYSLSKKTRKMCKKCSKCGHEFTLIEIYDPWAEKEILENAINPFLGGDKK